MSSPRPLTLVHLSDLQFGRNHRFDRLTSFSEDGSVDSLFSRLRDDLKRLQEEHGLTPDLLAVTGDLAEWGMPSEFKEVFTFLDRMAELLKLTRDRILVVPGNHDINRKECLAYFAKCEANEQTPEEPYWEKLNQYAQFFQRFYDGFPSIRFTQEQPWTLFEIPALKVVVAGLNSTMKESHLEEHHYGWVGEDQLRWFAERLRTFKERGWMRIGLIHHNVTRRPVADKENLRDADALQRTLVNELNLLLQGHTHEARLEWLDPSVPALSTGSASVIHEARPQEVPNQYQMIRLLPDQLWYVSRQYAPDRKGWIADPRVSPSGEQGFHQKRVLFEHVETTFGSLDVGKTALPDDQLAKSIETYRARLAASFQLQTLHDLCGRAEDQDLPGGLALLDIFIPQAVNLSPPPKDLPRGTAPEESWEELLADDETELSTSWGDSPPQPVDQLLLDPEKPWVLLLGAPGAGKTSLTRWLCLKLCTPGEVLPHFSSELVPVRVEMRDFDNRYRAATNSGRSYDFFDYLDQEHTERALPLRGDVLRKLGERGRLVWLFDGIDEVPDPLARKRYAEMILGRRAAEPARGVITSRIVGAQPVLPYFQAQGIPVCTLLDFDEPRIHEFIARWHDLAFPSAPAEGVARRQRLERVIAENLSVRDLCKNPLLLTLIALINRGTELPQRRHRLYRQAIELMANQWEVNKGIPAASKVRFDLDDKLQFLRELALWMQFELPEGSRNLVPEEDLLGFTSGFIAKHQGGSPEQTRRYAQELLSHLRERNYILARIGERLYGFVHKTFLEYFVADGIRSWFASRQLQQEWFDNFFHQSWGDDAWHEVLTLFCGMLDEDRPENVMELLQRLLRHVPVFPVNELEFAGFAVRCLSEVRQLDREPLRTFMLRLTEFAQHAMGQSEFIRNFDGLTETLHLIGPRWPERERWSQWVDSSNRRGPAVRVLANWCALGTTPVEMHETLLLMLLRNERSAAVARLTLTKADLPEERIHALLKEGEEGVRCAMASGLLSQIEGMRLYQGRFTEEALITLRELVTSTEFPSIKIRAASILAELEPNPRSREVLLECVHDRSSHILDTLDSLRALGFYASNDPQLVLLLQGFLTRSPHMSVRLIAVSGLIHASRSMEATESMLGWFEQFPQQRNRKAVTERLLLAANSDPQVEKLLGRLRVEGQTEGLRKLAAHVCEEVALRQELKKLLGRPLSDLLAIMEAPTTSEKLRQRLAWNLAALSTTEDDFDRVQEVLHKMMATDSPPASRLAAVRAMRMLSLDVDEGMPVYRELANSSEEEKVRLQAAQMLGEEGRPLIEALASSTADEDIRRRVKNVQKSLQLRAALQESI